MNPHVRVLVRNAMNTMGLLPTAYRAYRYAREWRPGRRARNEALRRAEERAGLPVPPGELMFSVAGSWDVAWFLHSGRESAESLRAALAAVGRPLASCDAVLDFGCGCGRVLRHMRDDGPRRLFGCDYNPAGVAWVREHLPHVTVAVNELAPPLPYEARTFDAVYALSVFTHLSAPLQDAWLRELHRVLRPGGLLLFSARGERYAHRLRPNERARLATEGLVVRDAQLSGTNICSVWHGPAYVERHAASMFRLLRHLPDGARGNQQDLYVLERLP